ncbi:MAG: DNA polymerase III subunit beta [Candidatus Omnitrophota bacterium]|jgi:DNA polymerase-3 subunit beta|nr:MAG: DNA polymerase III subunit beta [Candidatus Omnitrophota bacterium]
MKFTSSYQTWGRGINAVQNATGSVISNPIVENIFVKCEGDKVCFIATNLSLTIRCEGEAKVEESGSIVLPKEEITKVVREFPSEDVIFSESDGVVRIQCGEFRGKLKGQSGDLFPPFMEVEEGEELRLESGVLKDIIRKTLYVTSQEKSRYELNGVKFDKVETEMKCVATDGRRMALFRYQKEEMPSNTFSPLVPVNALQEIQHSFPDEGEVKMKVQERKIQFECGDSTIISNLLTDKFPQYDRIIPQEGDIRIVMDREKMLSGVRRAAIFSSMDTGMIIVRVENGKIEIFGERSEVGGEGRDYVNTDYEGEKLEMRYNYKFLMDFLRVMDEEQVELKMWDQKKPGIFRGVGNDSYLYVLMPMKPPEDESE